MSTLEKFFSLAFFLVGLLVVIKSNGNFNNVIYNVGTNSTGIIEQLQGRGGKYRTTGGT